MKEKILTSLTWESLNKIAANSLQTLTILLLGFLLEPAEFGLAGIAGVFITVTVTLSRAGFQSAIIQQPEVDDTYFNTVFWLGSGLSVILMGISLLFAKPLAMFLGNQAVAPLVSTLSVIFLINATSQVPEAILKRKMKFKVMAKRGAIATLAYGIVGILSALLGLGAWSLVAARITRVIVTAIVFYTSVSWRPRFVFDLSLVRQISSYSSSVLFAILLGRLLSQADYFVIGRFLGTEALGYYTLAFNIAVVPQQRGINIIQQVFFPAMAEIQNNIKRIGRIFLRGFRFTVVLMGLFALLVALLGADIVKLFYGGKWAPMVALLPILAVAGFLGIADFPQPLMYGLGYPSQRVWVNIARMFSFGIIVWLFGLKHGIEGVAISIVISYVIALFFSLSFSKRLINSSWHAFLHPLFVPLLVAGLSFTAVLAVSSKLNELNILAYLVFKGAVLVVVYVAPVSFLFRNELKELLIFVSRRFAREN